MRVSPKPCPYSREGELETVIETVPIEIMSPDLLDGYVEAAIYLYFAITAAIGLYLQRRVWEIARRSR